MPPAVPQARRGLTDCRGLGFLESLLVFLLIAGGFYAMGGGLLSGNALAAIFGVLLWILATLICIHADTREAVERSYERPM